MHAQRIDAYLQLTQPHYLLSNSFSVIAGFLIGTSGILNGVLFAATIFSITLLAGGGIVLFRYINSDLDATAVRDNPHTRSINDFNRYSVFAYSGMLMLAGLSLVAAFITPLAVVGVAVGGALYLGLFGYIQRRYKWGKMFSNLPAALVVMYGYIAATNRIDMGTVSLFIFASVVYLVLHFAVARLGVGFIDTFKE